MITCGGLDCSVCSFLQLAQSIINWMLGISAAVAVIVVIYAGFSYLLHNENKELLKKNNGYLKHAVYGFAFVLIFFWVFNAVYLTLGAKDKASWFRINCIQERAPASGGENQEEANKQVVWTNDLGLAVIDGSSVYPSVSNPQTVTKIKVSDLDPYNILLDASELEPGQVLKLISSDSENYDDILKYLNENEGTVSDDGDRMAENMSFDEVVKIEKSALGGAIIITANGQEIVVDPSISADMEKFQNLLKESIDNLRDDKSIYVYSKKKESDQVEQKGCPSNMLKTKKCPVSRCEGVDFVTYPYSVKNECKDGKVITKKCNPIKPPEYSKECQDMKNANTLAAKEQAAGSNSKTPNNTQKWLNEVNNAMSGKSGIPRPNDNLNDWEKSGTDEGSAPLPTGSGPSGQGQGQSPSGTGPTDSNGNQTGRTNTDTGNSTGGSEEARALEQKLVRIPEGLLANNKGVTPYVINECTPKLQQAAVELDKLKPGWKLYPSSIYRSDQKQTAMWDRSSQNEKYIARPKARGGRGSQHSSGNALDLKFQNANRQIISMSSQDKALLRQVMTSAGMLPYDAEWWHFYCIKPFRF